MIFDRRKLINFHESFSTIIIKGATLFKMQFNEYILLLCLTIQNCDRNPAYCMEIATMFFYWTYNIFAPQDTNHYSITLDISVLLTVSKVKKIKVNAIHFFVTLTVKRKIIM